MQVSVNATRHDRATAIYNAIDEVEYIASPEVGNAALAPERQHVPFEGPSHQVKRSVLSLIPPQSTSTT